MKQVSTTSALRPNVVGEKNIDLNKCLDGGTMQIDDDDNNVQEIGEHAQKTSRDENGSNNNRKVLGIYNS
ncbi:hypothetical protein JHK84_042826 [Glycine max]|nr:hypothetical protein JHK84_042826 [Glycine max]